MLLTELHSLSPDLPVMIEHLDSEDEYDRAAAFIRGRASKLGIEL